MATWDSIDNSEKCRRLIDLFLISVLLDAGAGTEWSYKSTENGRIYRRSEGIAVASLEMFKTVCALLHLHLAQPRADMIDREYSQATSRTSTRLIRMGYEL